MQSLGTKSGVEGRGHPGLRGLMIPAIGLAIGIAFAAPTPAAAQGRPAPARPVAPPPTPTRPAPAPEAGPLAAAPDLTAAVPGGVTADQVGSRAMQTSFAAKGALDNVETQEARVDQARASYYPRVGVLARYTRLSEFTAPSFFGQKFPLVFDQYLTQATLTVPISDYFLRIGKAYTAATRAAEASRYDLVAAKATSYSDGKLAYFTWLRARGGITVAEQSLAVARAHQKDADNLFAVGNASKVDVLRAQTQVAAAELSVERAKNNAFLAEAQIKVAMHSAPDEALAPGEPLDVPLARPSQDLKTLVAEAHASRAELKSLDKNAEALRTSAAVARAGSYPQLSAFGDVTYANPNPRRFPVTKEWFPTWAAGVQVSWSPNDILTSAGGAAELEAKANAIEAQRQATRDGIALEVTQGYQELLTADAAMDSTKRQLESALEGYRVARELFNNGRGTGTTLVDAEVALAQARFDNLNARVDARTARVRLEHATGQAARTAAAASP